MKQYSSNRAQKGRLAYRTPDRFIAFKVLGKNKRPSRRYRFKSNPWKVWKTKVV